MKKIIRLTERDITRIINKVLKEETCSNDTPVTITKTSNISEVKVCVGRTEKMKCTNHKVEVCFNGICSKVKIKDAYICDGLEAEIKPSEDSGVFIKNSFKTLLYPWIDSDGYLKIESGWDAIKKPLDKMINGNYPINVNVGYGVTVKIK
jgi:hypothetical protein